MKKIFAILLSVILLFSLVACSNSGNTTTTSGSGTNSDSSSSVSSTGLPTVLNTMEYTLYQNIFFNGQADQYLGQEITKEGTFATIIDKYNNTTRYYVWGYNDNTKCCDWQWELVFKKGEKTPSDGSLIEVTGTFEKSDDALDGYWFTDCKATVKEKYTGPKCDIDLTCMGATLERVQLANIQNFKEDFEGQTIYLYGRILNMNSLQHPYYDETWSQDFVSDKDVPAIGTCVILTGTIKDGVIQNAVATETKDY